MALSAGKTLRRVATETRGCPDVGVAAVVGRPCADLRHGRQPARARSAVGLPATGAGPGATTSARITYGRRTGRGEVGLELPSLPPIVPQVVRQLPALRAISRFLNILRAGNGRYATVRSSSSPFSSSVRSSSSRACVLRRALPSRRVVFEDVRAGIVATLRRHRNDDRDELSAHEVALSGAACASRRLY